MCLQQCSATPHAAPAAQRTLRCRRADRPKEGRAVPRRACGRSAKCQEGAAGGDEAPACPVAEAADARASLPRGPAGAPAAAGASRVCEAGGAAQAAACCSCASVTRASLVPLAPLHARRRLLQLQQQARVLDLDERVDVREPGLHECEAALDGVVPVRDLLAHVPVVGRGEVAREQLHELVLHVLYEVQPRAAVPHHHKHSQVRVWLLDAVVEHPHEHGRVLVEVHHQLLALLQQAETRVVQRVRVVEEEVGLAAELNAHAGIRALLPVHEYLHLDRLQGAHLLRRVAPVRGAQLEGHLALVVYPVVVGEARVHLLDGAEVQVRQVGAQLAHVVHGAPAEHPARPLRR
eukprot:CAMPEP_0183793668 /NCGR_PEP_ID=MMETSP0803_2-20130417/3363_1 /TAXON_ID=195967 /ORGANISM="Crustomastix stigmata, Strain CCMP3273" /LENGTH=348 /DNA_ID=CAMNT_0026038053 /DNA_START=216 /DNA_END=1259 /DNA_ORIENTATION=+